MEVLSAVASIVAIAEIVAKLTKNASELYTRIHDAPTELLSLTQHLQRIHTCLKDLSQIESTVPFQLIPNSTRLSLNLILGSVGDLLSKLERSCVKYGGKNGRRLRLRLVLLDSTKLKRLSHQLHQVEEDLSLTLQIISM
jgi:hypothetical protein